MTAKYCAIEGCGRRLKTGRKYYHEHRNTRAENPDKIINNITKDYIRRCEDIIETNVNKMVISYGQKEDLIYQEKLKLLDSISKKDQKYIDFIKHQLKLKKEAKEFNRSFFK